MYISTMIKTETANERKGKMMTLEELDKKARAVAPKWMLDECDSIIRVGQEEDWEDPPEHLMDWLDWVDAQDWTDCRSFRMAVTKIERAVGIQRKLGKDEEVYEFSNSRSRVKREGDWVFNKRWDELIAE